MRKLYDETRILYISALASEKKIAEEHKRTGANPGFAVQKFSRLLVKGLLENGAKVKALSNHSNYGEKKKYVSSTEEVENEVTYKYIPYFNLPFIKHICLFWYTFIYVLFFGLSDSKEKAIICDVLTVSVCMGALLASKINRVQSVAVVTDLYWLMPNMDSRSFLIRLAGKLNAWYIKSFNKYILLTEQMNEVVNPKKRPYMVMEALCDYSLMKKEYKIVDKDYPRTIIYAGGINEIYGLKMLAEGFIKANLKDVKLVYYGHGSYVNEFIKLCESHPNLEYRGIALNETVVADELKASLLVNPRFTSGDFTKYSFPSKNMEYMASGTALLTTRLSGMPCEYSKYVYFFEEETIEGYARAIANTISLGDEELKQKGISARNFVLQEKNNIKQSKRVIDFLNVNMQ